MKVSQRATPQQPTPRRYSIMDTITLDIKYVLDIEAGRCTVL